MQTSTNRFAILGPSPLCVRRIWLRKLTCRRYHLLKRNYHDVNHISRTTWQFWQITYQNLIINKVCFVYDILKLYQHKQVLITLTYSLVLSPKSNMRSEEKRIHFIDHNHLGHKRTRILCEVLCMQNIHNLIYVNNKIPTAYTFIFG